MNQGKSMTGWKIKIGKYKFRIWSNGFEYGDHLGGRVYFFPWTKTYREAKRLKKKYPSI